MSLVEKIQSQKKSVFLLIGIVLGGLYYYSSMQNLESKDLIIENKKNELQGVEDSIAEAKKIAGDKVKFEEENAKISDQLKAALEFLPTQLNEQEILQKVSAEARSAGVNPTSIQPKKSQQKGFYEELQMEIEMEGSYTQLVLFLSFISKLQRIVNLRGLEMKVKEFAEDVPILKMKGTIVAYRYLEKPAEQSSPVERKK